MIIADAVIDSATPPQRTAKIYPYKIVLKWSQILFMSTCHILAIFGLYQAIYYAKWQTTIWCIFLAQLSTLGVTAGAHRLWTHKSYKAKLPLQILLAAMFTLGHQQSIYKWARDHRVHHKFSDTDGDPYNAVRGFFFSHIGWLLCEKHPELIDKAKNMSFSDLMENPVVSFQHRHYYKILPFISLLLPMSVPVYFWDEAWSSSFLVSVMLRYCYSLNVTLTVNSVAHKWGYKPYDKNIYPVENMAVSLATLGEGWHNYHHAFPQDYKAAELGYFAMNPTTTFIDLMAKIGQAYDLRTTSEDHILKRIEKTGDIPKK